MFNMNRQCGTNVYYKAIESAMTKSMVYTYVKTKLFFITYKTLLGVHFPWQPYNDHVTNIKIQNVNLLKIVSCLH